MPIGSYVHSFVHPYGMRIFSLYLIIFGMFLGELTIAAPIQVILIRHAEKPRSGPNLSEKGKKRALALYKLFEDKRIFYKGPPSFIVAAAQHDEGSSLRSLQTVEPLAARLGIRVIDDFVKGDVDDLTDWIYYDKKFNNKVVLIVWPHKELHKIANEFGVRPKLDSWNDEVFDRMWVLNFEEGWTPEFLDLPQNLLPGDSKN